MTTTTTTDNTILPTATQLIGERLLKALFEEITQLRTPWAITPQQMQAEVIDRLRSQVENAVRTAVSGIAAAGFTYAPVRLDSLTVKEGAKATLLLSRGTEAMHVFADQVGSSAIIVFADPKDYTENMDSIRAQADQNALPLE